MHKIQSSTLRKSVIFKLISSVVVLIIISALFVAINIKTPIPDSVIGLDVAPSKFLQYIFHYWSSVDLGQRVNGSTIAYLPIALIYVALQFVGFSILQIQQIWFTTILSIAATSMFFFYRCWWKDLTIIRGFLAGLIYAFSPFVLLNLKGASVLLLSYAVLPFLAFQLILVVRKQQMRYVIGVVIAGAILVPGINPPDNAIMFFGAAVIGMGELARQNWRKDGIKWMLFAWFVLILVSMWWIVPFVDAIGAGGASSYFITDPLSMDAASSSFFRTLGLNGFWALYQGWNGIPYYPSQTYLISPLVSALMLLLPTISFLAIRASWRDRGVRILAWLIVVSVPMAVSIYPVGHPAIIGVIYQWIYNHFFAFRAFRSTYKWVALLAFSYAVFAPTLFGIDYGLSNLKPIKTKWINDTFLASIGAVVNGAILGSIILFIIPFSRNWVFPKSYRLGSIPNYWYQAAKWLDTQPGNGRVLFLPSTAFSTYNWGFPGGDIAQFLLHRPEITYQLGTPMPIKLMDELNQAPSNSSISLSKILYLLGVKYVVQRNDINYSYYGSPSPNKMNSYLSSKPFLHPVATFGALRIYKSALGAKSVLGTAPSYESIVSDSRSLSSELKVYKPGVLTKFRSAKIVYPKISKFQSSSIWNGLSQSYGPQIAFQATGSAWVSSVPGGVGQWLQADFKQPQKINQVIILGRNDGVDALPTKLKVTAGNKSIVVPVSSMGEAKVNFNGLVAPNLRVTILSSGKGGPNVGIAQIIIKGIHPSKFIYPKIPMTSPIRYIFHFNPLIVNGMAHEVMGGGGRRVTLSGTIFSDPFMTNKVLSSYLIPQGVTSVSSSSQWSDMAAYSPLWTISSSQSGSWVSNVKGGIGQWIRFDFPQKRWLGNITIQGRRNPFDAQATKIAIHLSSGMVEVHNLHWTKNGSATIPINQTTKFLKIVILAHQPNKGPHVGFSKIYISGVGVKLNPQALLPPNLFLNGKPIGLHMAKRPSLVNLVDGFSSWKYTTAPIKLGYGKQLLQNQSRGLFTGNKLLLAAGRSSSAKINWLPQKRVTQSSFESNISSQKGYLFLAEQADPFWHATINKRSLMKAGGADVYGEVWKLPGTKGDINVAFRPKTTPTNWLITFGLASGVAILFGLSTWIIRGSNFYQNKIKKLHNKK